jgi:SPP1 gp7 family putative phage head morphogenesis protein
MAFGPTSKAHVAQIRLGDLLARHLAAANLLGRLHVAKVALAKTKRPVHLATVFGRTLNFAERPTDAEILAAVRRLGPAGNYQLSQKLKQELPGITDAQIIRLADKRKLVLAHWDLEKPSAQEAERRGLIRDAEGEYFLAVAIPHDQVAESPPAPQPAASEAAEGETLGIGFSFNIPNTGAIDYLRDLTPVTRHVFDGLTNEYRNDAFTVAGVSDQNLIGKIRDALSDVLAKGGTPDSFRKDVNELCTEAGVEKLAAFELDTIFQTNVGKAYSAGRLEQLREPGLVEALPYWQYWTAGDLRVRPAHAVLDGFCARAIDPVWRRIYPPNGFNCRCSVIPVTEEEAPKGSSEGGIERLPVMAAFARPPGWNALHW